MIDNTRDKFLIRAVQWTLLFGVVFSGMLMALGIVFVFLRNEPRPEGPPPDLGVLLRGAFGGDGLSLIELAMLSLMITPVLRVAILAVGWTCTGPRRFAVVAFVVLTILGIGIVMGLG
jgi:uncharacterized membrane protein